jgi:hypothetical protein
VVVGAVVGAVAGLLSLQPDKPQTRATLNNDPHVKTTNFFNMNNLLAKCKVRAAHHGPLPTAYQPLLYGTRNRCSIAIGPANAKFMIRRLHQLRKVCRAEPFDDSKNSSSGT